ncbi:MAG: bifunctional methionine sulfoxide reductase B/A protein [Phycisphaerales bacterium]
MSTAFGKSVFLLTGLLAVAGSMWLAIARAEQPGNDLLRSRMPGSEPSPGEKSDMKMAETSKDQPSTKKLSRSAYDITPLTNERIEELAKKLKPEESRVILNKGTEPAFCGNLLDNKKQGTYTCRLCQLPLFSSEHKFNSGTGWPSFFQPVDVDHVAYKKDGAHGMERIEILCTRCGGHLGHVFEDGPAPTGLRYCLNSVSLEFFEKGAELPAKPLATQTAYFAGGCFWGVEDRFQQTPGVVNSVSGYMGGKVEKPTYKQVCSSDTGHAETVMVTFDPSVISYTQLLEKFFKFHDATTLNRQGPDEGEQYRSAIFTNDEEQQKAARALIDELSKKPKYQKRPIVTQVLAAKDAGEFWPAEAYHQDYHEKHGGHCAMPPSDGD